MPRTFRRRYKRTYRRRTFKRFYKKYKRTFNKNIAFFKRTKTDVFQLTQGASSGEHFTAIYSDVNDSVYNRFALDQIPNYTELTALYDSYKICAIKQKFVFSQNSAELGAVGTEPIGIPNLITVHDYNDTTALTDEGEALQYKTYKIRRLDKPISRYFKPTQSNTTSGVSQIVKRRWNPMTASDIIHLGIKSAYTSYNFTTNASTLGSLKVYTTYYIQCRTPK